MGKPLNKIIGTRYITYYLMFPKDKDMWVEQIPFVNHLDFEIGRTKFPPMIKRALLEHGAAEWKDQNGVVHIIKIEDKPKPRKWGVNRPDFKLIQETKGE